MQCVTQGLAGALPALLLAAVMPAAATLRKEGYTDAAQQYRIAGNTSSSITLQPVECWGGGCATHHITGEANCQLFMADAFQTT
jgi:hypothetical protein